MREILFRGRRTHSRQWAFGFYTKSPSGNFYITETSCGVASPKTVEPETVGQFTGLTDKNGKKIFEGDVLKNIDGICLVSWDEEKSAFVMHMYEYPYEILYLEEMCNDSEIIGNINDNPEFLETP